MKDYTLIREEIYRPLQNYFDWSDMYGQEYALPYCHSVTSQQCREIRLAAVELGRIIKKTVAVISRGDDSLLAELGIPENAWSAVRVASLFPTLIGRFDFALTESGFKMLEYNADTPSGIVEAFSVNSDVCNYWRCKDPNDKMADKIGAVFAKWRENEDLDKDATVFFSALDWHREDFGNTKYLLRQSGLEASFVALSDLRVMADAVYAVSNEGLKRIDVLFRMHPLEILSGDVSEDGFPVGAALLRHVAEGRLRLLNPPSALLAQTKSLQALIWSVAEQGDCYTTAEQALIKRYMLPTYFENRFQGRCSYVTKPVFGREGLGVKIYDAAGRLETGEDNGGYENSALIYQEKTGLEQVRIKTCCGEQELHLLWGVFLLGDEAGAIILRAGGKITDDMAYYLPACLG